MGQRCDHSEDRGAVCAPTPAAQTGSGCARPALFSPSPSAQPRQHFQGTHQSSHVIDVCTQQQCKEQGKQAPLLLGPTEHNHLRRAVPSTFMWALLGGSVSNGLRKIKNTHKIKPCELRDCHVTNGKSTRTFSKAKSQKIPEVSALGGGSANTAHSSGTHPENGVLDVSFRAREEERADLRQRTKASSPTPRRGFGGSDPRCSCRSPQRGLRSARVHTARATMAPVADTRRPGAGRGASFSVSELRTAHVKIQSQLPCAGFWLKILERYSEPL